MTKFQVYLMTTISTMLVGGAACAQDSAAAGTGLGDIIVTAQKREQKLIDVPMAISVVTGEELKAKGIESVQDLSFSVPGLTMREDGPGSYTIFLRGLANQSGSGALVGLYLDEVPLSLDGYNQLSPVELDYARVEVLKGPQGTLYGQGSAGGTIRFITNKPKLDRIEGHVEAQVYDVSHGAVGGKGEAVINLPIVKDQLALRLAGSYEAGGGWIDQPEAGIKNGNGTRLLNLRGKLLWAPSDNFEAEAMVQVHRAKTKLGLGFEEPDRTVDVGIDRGERLIPKKFDFTIYNLELRYDLGFAKLVSATSYIDHKHNYPFTYIPRPGNFSYNYVEGNDLRYVRAHQFSQEVRLQSSGKPFEYTIGGFYRSERNTMLDTYEYIYSPDGTLSTNGGTLYQNLYYYSYQHSKSYSLFADAAYHITDRLTVGAGVRYFHDHQKSLITYVPDAGELQTANFHSIDPRVYASYKYADKGTLYASFGKGFRSGGFNSAPFAPYKPEKIFTYEVGTKGALFDNHLLFDLAGFYTIYKDMVRRRLTQVGGAYLSESSNIGKVKSKGVELGLTGRVMKGLTLDGTLAYVHSQIVATDPEDPVNLPGDRTDYSPRWSWTIGANYAFDWAANMPGFIRVDFNHRDHVTYIDRSSFYASVLPQVSDSLNLLNARVGATVRGVKAEIFGENLTNQNKAVDPYVGWANSNRTRPRVVGVKLGYDF
ncbi:TonB-dependent receptor [Flavisphingomonas formosensis]|uniref:TonB-dependent receptor n=1 Tax=Flavisphingomonas formosensis TaxID=861534 RepID=UPI0012F92E71|nr:TonB-dependent receptor [Sphingomonas formosensis]